MGAMQQLLQNPEQMRQLAELHPLVQLARLLQQLVGGVAQQVGGAAQQVSGAAQHPSGANNLPGNAAARLQHIIESLQNMVTSGTSNINRSSAGGAPGCPLVEQLVQTSVQGIGQVANVVNRAASGVAGGGPAGGIPIVGQVGSAVHNVLSGVANPQGRYDAQVDQLVAMGF